MCYPSPRLSILTVPSWQFPLHMWHCGLSAARSQHPRKVTLLPFSLPSVLAVPALWRLRAKTFLVIFLGDNKEYCLLSVTVLLPAVPQLLVHMHEKTAALITALTPFVHTDPSLWAWYRHTKSCWCQRMAPNALQPCPAYPPPHHPSTSPTGLPASSLLLPWECMLLASPELTHGHPRYSCSHVGCLWGCLPWPPVSSCIGGAVVKNLPAHAGDPRDTGLIPGLGRFPGGGKGNLLQYSCLEIFHRQRSLAGYSTWGCKESNTTFWAWTHLEWMRASQVARW